MSKIYASLLMALFIFGFSSCKKDEESISECTEGIWTIVEECELDAQGQVINCETATSENCTGAPAEVNHWNFKSDGTLIANYGECDDNDGHLCISYDEGTWGYNNDVLTISFNRYYDCEDEEFQPYTYSFTVDATCNDNEMVFLLSDGDNARITLARP